MEAREGLRLIQEYKNIFKDPTVFLHHEGNNLVDFVKINVLNKKTFSIKKGGSHTKPSVKFPLFTFFHYLL
jgi:hypothetical protein